MAAGAMIRSCDAASFEGQPRHSPSRLSPGEEGRAADESKGAAAQLKQEGVSPE